MFGIKKSIVFIIFITLLSFPAMAQEIFEAIEHGNIDKVRELIENNEAAIHIKDRDKNTPLHYTAISGNKDIAELLISKEAQLDAQNYQGYTPLHYAAFKNHPEVVEMLISKGTDIHIKTKRGRTPLFLLAMNNGNVSIAKMLIDAGANVNVKENSGGTPITYSAFRGFNGMSDVLLDHGAEVRVDTELWFEVFHRACSFGHKRLAEVMISKGIDIERKNEDGRVPLHSAAEGGSLELVKFLIEKGNAVNSVDYCGATPLHFSASSGHPDVVEKLIELGAEVNLKNVLGETPFNLASEKENQKVVELLITKGAEQYPPQFPVFRGPYLGQNKPNEIPAVFAAGLVSSYAPIHGCVTFSPDGKEMYWSIADFKKRGSSILYMKIENERWTAPEPSPFASEYSDDVPFFSPDGQKLYFLSNRPNTEGSGKTKENIWYMEKEGNMWSKPKLVGPSINSMDLHWQFSVTFDGTLYFASSEGIGMGLNDIYRSRLVEGKYEQAENLGDAINTEFSDFAPFISSDESFLIFSSSSRSDGYGGTDLYVSFPKKDGAWTKAQNMGPTINSGSGELLTTLSPDGKYLFFTGRRNGRKGVFWVDSKIIEDLKRKILE